MCHPGKTMQKSPSHNKIKIALTQTNCVLGDLDKNLERHYHFVEQAIEDKQDMVIFPELSLTGYSLKDAVYDVALTAGDTKYDKLRDYSRHISIIAGAVELNERYEIYNSLFYFEDGVIKTRHRKVYLPTYGLFEEQRYFSSGNRIRAFDTRHGRMGMLICEDIWHPTSGLILAHDGASFVVVCSAGVSRGMDESSKPVNVRTWETIVRSVAITSTSYVVFSNRVGVEDGLLFFGGSELAGPDGITVHKASYFEEATLHTEIDLLKLKHARINTTLLSDEKLHVLIEEFRRLQDQRNDY